ncbi:MAG: efflux RND transporter periplasmic adaptor subunit [Nitrospirota bacterium]
MTVRTNLLRELEREFLPSESKGMPWKSAIFLLLIGIAIGAGILSLYIYFKGGPAAARFLGLGIPVETMTVKGMELTEVVGASGRTIPAFATEVKSTLSGKIHFLPVGVGVAVTKGHVLAQLDPAPYRAALKLAQEKFTKSKTNLEKSEIFEKRMNELFSRRLLSSTELEKATRELDAARVYFSDAAAELMMAQDNLDQTVITASSPGIIIEQKVTIGQMVHPKETLFALGTTESVSILVPVSEEKANHIMTGQEVDIVLDSYPDTTMKGEVEKVEMGEEEGLNNGRVMQKMNVSIRVQSEFKMKTGLSAYVWIKSHRRGLTIPRFGLIQSPDRKSSWDWGRQESVFIVENSRVRTQQVRLGTMRKNLVEVVEGLQEGQEVVIQGASNLRENDRITRKVSSH